MTDPAGWTLPDIAGTLSTRTLHPGELLYRAHRLDLDAVWFGPAPGEQPRGRYDSHDGSYRVCYLGLSERAAFVEGVLHRAIPRRLVSEQTLSDRAIAEVRVLEPIRAVCLYGEHLIPNGATAEVAHGEPYRTVSWPWSRAVFDHAERVDGILYSARHDDSQLALALYDRAAHKIEAGESHPLSGDDLRTLRMLDLYGLGLDSSG